MAGPTHPVPATARVVIIGGGVMGCGIAYHLAHEGWTDIVLLEKAELTSGSTWHAAGQITHSTSSFALGKCVDYNIGLYNGGLEAETGQSTTWHDCGSFRLAYDEDEMDWLRYTRSVNIALGFNSEVVDPAFVRAHHPFYNLDGVLGALHTPDDGHVDPSGVTLGLAKGARQLGATDTVNANDGDCVEQIKEMTKGGVDFAIELAGVPKALETAYQMCRRGGTVVTAGLPRPEATLDIPIAQLVSDNRTVKGSYMGSCIPRRDIPRFLSLYRQGKLPVDRLRSGFVDFDGLNAGFDRLAAGDAVRQVLRPHGTTSG